MDFPLYTKIDVAWSKISILGFLEEKQFRFWFDICQDSVSISVSFCGGFMCQTSFIFLPIYSFQRQQGSHWLGGPSTDVISWLDIGTDVSVKMWVLLMRWKWVQIEMMKIWEFILREMKMSIARFEQSWKLISAKSWELPSASMWQ